MKILYFSKGTCIAEGKALTHYREQNVAASVQGMN